MFRFTTPKKSMDFEDMALLGMFADDWMLHQKGNKEAATEHLHARRRHEEAASALHAARGAHSSLAKAHEQLAHDVGDDVRADHKATLGAAKVALDEAEKEHDAARADFEDLHTTHLHASLKHSPVHRHTVAEEFRAWYRGYNHVGRSEFTMPTGEVCSIEDIPDDDAIDPVMRERHLVDEAETVLSEPEKLSRKRVRSSSRKRS